jgi:hypothetical protein
MIQEITPKCLSCKNGGALVYMDSAMYEISMMSVNTENGYLAVSLDPRLAKIEGSRRGLFCAHCGRFWSFEDYETERKELFGYDEKKV